jgi:membrane associated rhomboid family serine protease
MHLFVNMFGLYMFGSPLEQAFGTRRYLVYYVSCVITAALTQLVVLGISGTFVPTVGASGGVFGLLLGFAMLFPHTRIMLLFPPIPMRARTFAFGYAAIELVLGISGSSGVAHFAHLGGMLGGFLLLRYWGIRAQA